MTFISTLRIPAPLNFSARSLATGALWPLTLGLCVPFVGCSLTQSFSVPPADPPIVNASTGAQSDGETALLEQDPHSESHEVAASEGQELPGLQLKDPHGKAFDLRKLAVESNGLIVIVTAPTLSNQDAQEGWGETLKAGIDKERGRAILLQDMSVSWFQDTARSRMVEETDEDDNPLLLLDEEGEVARALGVEEEATRVFVFDANGSQVWENDGAEPNAELAEAAWAALDTARSES